MNADYATIARVLSRHIRNVDKLLAATDAVHALFGNDLSTHTLRVEFLRTDQRAIAMLAAGQWIQAIKLIREEAFERTGKTVPLKDAKDAVDEVRAP
jgi:hypothetical protein